MKASWQRAAAKGAKFWKSMLVDVESDGGPKRRESWRWDGA